jgi:hypothetical protein
VNGEACDGQTLGPEIAALRSSFADLRAQVVAQAPADKRDAAVERVDELEAALVTDKPQARLATPDHHDLTPLTRRAIRRLLATRIGGHVVGPPLLEASGLCTDREPAALSSTAAATTGGLPSTHRLSLKSESSAVRAASKTGRGCRR